MQGALSSVPAVPPRQAFNLVQKAFDDYYVISPWIQLRNPSADQEINAAFINLHRALKVGPYGNESQLSPQELSVLIKEIDNGVVKAFPGFARGR